MTVSASAMPSSAQTSVWRLGASTSTAKPCASKPLRSSRSPLDGGERELLSSPA